MPDRMPPDAHRSPYDGEPFYCVTCGSGFAEYGACEDTECKLETPAAALARQHKRRSTASTATELVRAAQAREE